MEEEKRLKIVYLMLAIINWLIGVIIILFISDITLKCLGLIILMQTVLLLK